MATLDAYEYVDVRPWGESGDAALKVLTDAGKVFARFSHTHFKLAYRLKASEYIRQCKELVGTLRTLTVLECPEYGESTIVSDEDLKIQFQNKLDEELSFGIHQTNSYLALNLSGQVKYSASEAEEIKQLLEEYRELALGTEVTQQLIQQCHDELKLA